MSEVHDKPGGCLAVSQSGGVKPISEKEHEANVKAALADYGRAGISGPPNYYADSFRASPNYSSRSAYRGSRVMVGVIHDMEASYEVGVSWLTQSRSQVSAHLAVGSLGQNCQMVGEQYAAWHVAYDNGFTIGIEHEGYASTGKYYTDAMYNASAKLMAGICHRYGIPVVRSTTHGICFHSDLGAAGGGHHDAGPYFDMNKYLSLVKQYLSGAIPTPNPTPVAPKPAGAVKWINAAFSVRDAESNNYAVAFAHGLQAVNAPAGITPRMTKAAQDAGASGIYTVLFGDDAVATLKNEAPNLSIVSKGPVMSANGAKMHDEARWRMDYLCKLGGYDSGAALKSFEGALSKM